MKYSVVWTKGRIVYILVDRQGEVKEYQKITMEASQGIRGELEDFDKAEDGVRYFAERGLIQDVCGV